MTWLEGQPLLQFKQYPARGSQHDRASMFRAWWFPFSHYGVIHGDPHLGNYTVFEEAGKPHGINLLDYGCIRTFPTRFVQGVIDLYTGLLTGNRRSDRARLRDLGLPGADQRTGRRLNIWARFIYGPLLDDRERTIAEGTTPGQYGRKEAFTVHKVLREKGPVTVPREFVFMDRAAIGLGGVFLHLDAAELVPAFQRNDRGIRPRDRCRTAEGGLRSGGGAAAGVTTFACQLREGGSDWPPRKSSRSLEGAA